MPSMICLPSMTCLRVDRAARPQKKKPTPWNKKPAGDERYGKANPREFQMKNRRRFCPRSTGELPGTCHPPKGSQGAVVLPDPWVKASGGPPPVESDEARLVSSGSTCYLSPVRFGATQAPTDTLSMMSVAGGRLRGRPCSSSERAGKHVAGKYFDTLTAGATLAPAGPNMIAIPINIHIWNFLCFTLKLCNLGPPCRRWPERRGMGDPGCIVTGVLVQPDCHYLVSPDSSSCLRAEAFKQTPTDMCSCAFGSLRRPSHAAVCGL